MLDIRGEPGTCDRTSHANGNIDRLAATSPALDRATGPGFEAWRRKESKGLKKLFEESDHAVNAKGEKVAIKAEKKSVVVGVQLPFVSVG